MPPASLTPLLPPPAAATCRNYGAYLIADAEEEWYPEEIAKLEVDVKEHGLMLMLFAEWWVHGPGGSWGRGGGMLLVLLA